ncbi:MAG: hypothetical protein FWF05_03910 [Oscillospiraceae bacterium]|nr:hypothetical protein [Oscillospiraceae bacterium]
MEDFVKDQLIATLKYAPLHLAASYFKKRTSPEAEEAKRKAGGFIKGICHPSDNYEQIKGGGIRWNRADIPFPFDHEGDIRQEYLDWKEQMRLYRENGIRIMAVTPYPRTYISYGIDPRESKNEDRVREIAVFLISDLRDIAEAWQITNEMGVTRFTRPLTMQEAARFIGIQLQAMYPRRGKALIGYNSSGPQSDLHLLMRPWLPYCDYVGIDIYIGCFVAAGNWMYMFDALLRYLWSMTGKPVILCEFGYLSGGAPKSPEEKRAILRRYGVSSEEEARKNLDQFMDKIKKVAPVMWSSVTENASGSYADYLFNSMFRNHFYSELPKGVVIKKYPHTPEGQADFYRDIFPRLAKLPFVLGAFIYKWRDGEKCGHCGQDDCPQESTRWGILDFEERERPAYYAVRDALEKIQ